MEQKFVIERRTDSTVKKSESTSIYWAFATLDQVLDTGFFVDTKASTIKPESGSKDERSFWDRDISVGMRFDTYDEAEGLLKSVAKREPGYVYEIHKTYVDVITPAPPTVSK